MAKIDVNGSNGALLPLHATSNSPLSAASGTCAEGSADVQRTLCSPTLRRSRCAVGHGLPALRMPNAQWLLQAVHLFMLGSWDCCAVSLRGGLVLPGWDLGQRHQVELHQVLGVKRRRGCRQVSSI